MNHRIFPNDPQVVIQRLYKNLGNKSFREVGETAKVRDWDKIPFCSTFFDPNNDGWPDIYTANDKLTLNTFLLNTGKGYFIDFGAFSGSNLRMNAMCVAVGDYDNNGWQDIYVSNTLVGNALLHNPGVEPGVRDLYFDEYAASLGVGYYGNGWGSNFVDADNDGDLDLYVSGSFVGSERVSSVFFEQTSTGFHTLNPEYFQGDTCSSFNNAIGSFNQDGLPDILVQNNPPFAYHLWENRSVDSAKHWVKVRLEGVISNRDAIGAQIEVYADTLYQMRYLHCGIGFLAQNSLTETIGLGAFSQVDSLVITWPTGHQDRFYELASRQLLRIREGSSTAGRIHLAPGVVAPSPINTLTSLKSGLTEGILLYPTPTKAHLFIQTLPTVDSWNYSLTNLMGQIIHQGTLQSPQFQISVAHLAPGPYFFQLYAPDGTRYPKKWWKK